LVYFAVGGAAVTAQDTQPGHATFAEMIAFARLASVPSERTSVQGVNHRGEFVSSRMAGTPAEEEIDEPTGKFLRPRSDIASFRLLAYLSRAT
jgi:hypothetical protein